MTNEQIISKMKEDMRMRGFSHWTEESYLGKTKDIMKYFRKSMEEVTNAKILKDRDSSCPALVVGRACP